MARGAQDSGEQEQLAEKGEDARASLKGLPGVPDPPFLGVEGPVPVMEGVQAQRHQHCVCCGLQRSILFESLSFKVQL